MKSLKLHEEYEGPGIDVGDLDPDPFAQFALWLGDAEDAGIAEPNAMVLSTVDADGAPSSRTVLLKGVLDGCFEFVTNTNSRKGFALAGEPRVALVFPWYSLRRQVIVDGSAEQAPTSLSDEYWATRPRRSQLGAWASEQSHPIAERALLEQHLAEVERRFEGEDSIPRPPHWGSWLVRPRAIEFWLGRRSRLHDRLVYRPAGADAAAADPAGAAWTLGRLQP